MRRAAAVLLAAGALACHKLPPDPDGQVGGAQTLQLGATQNDQIDCDAGDCADWYAIEVSEKSTLVLEVGAEAATSPDVDFEIVLYDSKGNKLGNEHSNGKSSLTLRNELPPATYYLAVGSQSSGVVIPYALSARNELPPKPVVREVPKTAPKPTAKKPTVETKRGSVLEIQDGGKSVLLDLGKSQGVRVGLRGRLIRGNATAGSLEIVEVYPEGSLAKITAGKADANTAAEVDIPIGAKAP